MFIFNRDGYTDRQLELLAEAILVATLKFDCDNHLCENCPNAKPCQDMYSLYQHIYTLARTQDKP